MLEQHPGQRPSLRAIVLRERSERAAEVIASMPALGAINVVTFPLLAADKISVEVVGDDDGPLTEAGNAISSPR